MRTIARSVSLELCSSVQLRIHPEEHYIYIYTGNPGRTPTWYFLTGPTYMDEIAPSFPTSPSKIHSHQNTRLYIILLCTFFFFNFLNAVSFALVLFLYIVLFVTLAEYIYSAQSTQQSIRNNVHFLTLLLYLILRYTLLKESHTFISPLVPPNISVFVLVFYFSLNLLRPTAVGPTKKAV